MKITFDTDEGRAAFIGRAKNIARMVRDLDAITVQRRITSDGEDITDYMNALDNLPEAAIWGVVDCWEACEALPELEGCQTLADAMEFILSYEDDR